MKNCILITILLSLLLVSSLSTGIQAATSVTVTITATGIIVEAPIGFDAYYITDHEVGIIWTKPVDAVSTMIRAAYGRYPTDRTDGYLVYYGGAESISDTAVTLDETAVAVYYRAWSENAESEWSEYAEDFVGGIGMTLIAFIILPLALTLGFFWKKSSFLGYGAAGTWALLGFLALQTSAGVNPLDIIDIYMALFWLCIVFTIGFMFLPLVMRDKAKDDDLYPTELLDDDKPLYDEMQAEAKDRKRMDIMFGTPRKKKPKMSKFARTGRE